MSTEEKIKELYRLAGIGENETKDIDYFDKDNCEEKLVVYEETPCFQAIDLE